MRGSEETLEIAPRARDCYTFLDIGFDSPVRSKAGWRLEPSPDRAGRIAHWGICDRSPVHVALLFKYEGRNACIACNPRRRQSPRFPCGYPAGFSKKSTGW